MTALVVTSVVFSLIVLAAHFLRAGNLILFSVCLALNVLLAVRHPWARRALQVVLGLGAFEWLRVTFTVAETRVRAGEPWERMAVILVAAAAVAVLGAFGLESERMRARFGGSG